MASLISATMAIALAEMSERGGELVRWQGGFWTYPGCLTKRERVPAWYVSAHTINALLRRGEIVAVEKGAWGGPIRVRLSDANAAALSTAEREGGGNGG